MPLPWSERIGNAAVSCVTYVVQFFYPVDLAAFYPAPPGGPPHLESGRRDRDLGRRQRGRGDLAAAVSLLALSAGSGIWACCLRCWDWSRFPITRWPIVTCICPALGSTSRWPGGPRGSPPAGPRGAGCSAPAPGWRSPCWWPVPPGRRRFGATTRRCGGTPWHVPPTTAKPNSAWPTRSLGKAGSTTRSPIIAGRSNTRSIPRPLTIWDRCWPSRASWTRPSPSFVGRWRIDPDSFAGSCQPGPGAGAAESIRRVAGTFPPRPGNQPARRRRACGLAHLLRLEGRIDEARAEFERAVAIDPHNAAARNDLGSMLLRARKDRRVDRRVRGGLGHRSQLPPGPHQSGDGVGRARANRRGRGPLPPSLGNRSQQPAGSRRASTSCLRLPLKCPSIFVR